MLMVALTMSLSSFAVDWLSPPDACIDGIAYCLNRFTKEASVTFKGESPFSSTGDPNDEYIGAITIPSSITHEGITYKVTSINNKAFEHCVNITSITIPNSVTSIGVDAFAYCFGLTSITIPNSVTNIGNRAFNGCKGITSIIIPNSVTKIGVSAFMQCEGLTSVKIPDSVTEMGAGAFIRCTKLSSVTLGGGLKEILDGTFSECHALKSISIPNNIIHIYDYSFDGCTKLASVIIPSSVVYFSGGTFKGCTNLTSVTNLSCIPQDIDNGYEYSSVFSVYGDLHVLKGRKQAYQNAPVWNKFNIIDDVEITPTMVKETIDAIDNVQKIYAIDPAKKLNIVKFLITNARIAFDALSKEQQALVKNINLLIEAEETYGESTTGITDVNADSNKKDGKYFENGKIVIVKNGKKFNINGLKE